MTLRRLRLLTGGESHGPGLTAIVDGLPAGMPLDREALDAVLARRQHGYGRGRRQRIESDVVRVTGGLRDGRTLGSPLVLAVDNLDWRAWAPAMDPWEVDRKQADLRRRRAPRPGHADLAGGLGTDQLGDMRDVLERASARETAIRTAVGAVCSQLLGRYGIRSRAAVLAVGPETVVEGPPTWEDLEAVDPTSPLVTPRPADEDRLVALVDRASEEGDTLGGVVGAVFRGIPPGFGSHVHWDRKLDGRLAQAVASIPSVKAVAIGAGIEAAARSGSEVHDAIRPSDRGLVRPTNRAGGLEGGTTDGADLVVRGWFKPIATIRRGLPTVDLDTGEAITSRWERSDVTAIGAAPVIVEATCAIVLADALLDKLGGDAIADVDAAWRSYLGRIDRWWSPPAP